MFQGCIPHHTGGDGHGGEWFTCEGGARQGPDRPARFLVINRMTLEKENNSGGQLSQIMNMFRFIACVTFGLL